MVTEDPRVAQFEREREEAVQAAHKAMTTSYIGKPPPIQRGDADRMAAALLKAGWTPPSETAVEHGLLMSGGGVHVRADGIERVYPLADWIEAQKRQGAHVMRRRVIVVEDWTELPRG